MNVVTPTEMEQIDRETIEEQGLSSLVLMENAARGVLYHVPEGRVLVLAGPGNNGGDGLVLARALKDRGQEVACLLMSEKMSKDAGENLKLARRWGVSCHQFDGDALPRHLGEAGVLIDALFGTGLSRPLEGDYKRLVEAANEQHAFRVAVDIPSGIDGRNGQVLGCSVKADLTVTFGCLKRGHLLHPGKARCGRLVVTQPGFHPEAMRRFDRIQLFNEQVAANTLPSTWPTMHKGDNGRVLMVTGSLRYPGAGVISTLGALRAGAGLVTHYLPDELLSSLTQHTPEAMPRSRRQPLNLEGFNAVVLGCGLGPDTESLGGEVLASCDLPLVIDADCLSLVPKAAQTRRDRWVLTPHPGELARLLGADTGDLERDRIGSALRAAAELNCVVCSKGAPTITASPDGRAYVSSTGNPVLAQGGSGDLLAGIIGAYLAYGLPPLEAAASGVHIHGLASDLAAKRIGPRGVTATQIVELVPFAYGQVVGNPS